MPLPTSEDNVYTHVCPESYSNKYMQEFKWMFVPDLKIFPNGAAAGAEA